MTKDHKRKAPIFTWIVIVRFEHRKAGDEKITRRANNNNNNKSGENKKNSIERRVTSMYIYGRTGERVAEYMIVGLLCSRSFLHWKASIRLLGIIIKKKKKEEADAGSLFYRCQSTFPISLAGGVEKLNRIRCSDQWRLQWLEGILLPSCLSFSRRLKQISDTFAWCRYRFKWIRAL